MKKENKFKEHLVNSLISAGAGVLIAGLVGGGAWDFLAKPVKNEKTTIENKRRTDSLHHEVEVMAFQMKKEVDNRFETVEKSIERIADAVELQMTSANASLTKINTNMYHVREEVSSLGGKVEILSKTVTQVRSNPEEETKPASKTAYYHETLLQEYK